MRIENRFFGCATFSIGVTAIASVDVFLDRQRGVGESPYSFRERIWNLGASGLERTEPRATTDVGRFAARFKRVRVSGFNS